MTAHTRNVLRLVRGGQERAEYLKGVQRRAADPVRESVFARKKLQGPRPIDPLYRAMSNLSNPVAPVLQQIEGIAKLRDHADGPDQLRLYTTAMLTLADVVWEETIRAIEASDMRRKRMQNNTGGAA